MRRLVLSLVIGLVVAGCGGVALLATGAGLGVGTFAWIQGELKRSYPATYDVVYNASRDALQSLEMPVLSEQRDALQGTIMAKRADGNDVRVVVKYLTERTTEVGVRVGLFGDRPASTQIHESIQTRL